MTAEQERLRHARLLTATGRAGEALAEVEALLDEEPRNVGALLIRAALLRQSGALEAAEALYLRATGLAPASAEAWNERALCLHTLGRDDEALEAAQTAKALLAEPANAALAPSVYLTLIWCLREKRLYREALDAAEECLSRTPDAVVAEWAGQIEHELAEAERERC